MRDVARARGGRERAPVSRLTVAQYDLLERAIAAGTRIAVRERRRELVVVPERLSFEGTREVLHTRHPTTGERLVFALDALEGVDAVRA